MKHRLPRPRRPSPALVVATIALFVALTGSAAATRALITSRDIKNGTIQTVDLSPHTKASLHEHAKTADLAEQARALKDPASHRLILASATPAPGMLVPLDRKGHLPASVLPTIAARVYSSTDEPSPIQVVGDPVQRLHFDTVSFDTYHIFDLHRPTDLTAPVAGIYLITTNVAWPLQPNSRAGVNRAVYVFVNDRVIAADQRPPADGTLQTVTTLYKLEAGDVVDVGIAHDAPTLTAQALPDYAPSLAIALIAPG